MLKVNYWVSHQNAASGRLSVPCERGRKAMSLCQERWLVDGTNKSCFKRSSNLSTTQNARSSTKNNPYIYNLICFQILAHRGQIQHRFIRCRWMFGVKPHSSDFHNHSIANQKGSLYHIRPTPRMSYT